MARLRCGLVVLGLVGVLAASVGSGPTNLLPIDLSSGGARTAAAAPLSMTGLADDDDNPAPPTDGPADNPADMPPDGATDSPADTPTPTPTATPSATPTVTPTATATATPTVNLAVIKQVIQRSNDEQVQAVATRNASLVADTVTENRFWELAGIIQDMLNHRVTSIALLKLDWGPITVAADGSGATATTYETWRIVSQAGMIDYDPVRNDYALVRDNTTWKIKSDVQVVAPLPTTNIKVPPP
jgi:hypothetical protein